MLTASVAVYYEQAGMLSGISAPSSIVSDLCLPNFLFSILWKRRNTVYLSWTREGLRLLHIETRQQFWHFRTVRNLSGLSCNCCLDGTLVSFPLWLVVTINLHYSSVVAASKESPSPDVRELGGWVTDGQQEGKIHGYSKWSWAGSWLQVGAVSACQLGFCRFNNTWCFLRQRV